MQKTARSTSSSPASTSSTLTYDPAAICGWDYRCPDCRRSRPTRTRIGSSVDWVGFPELRRSSAVVAAAAIDTVPAPDPAGGPGSKSSRVSARCCFARSVFQPTSTSLSDMAVPAPSSSLMSEGPMALGMGLGHCQEELIALLPATERRSCEQPPTDTERQQRHAPPSQAPAGPPRRPSPPLSSSAAFLLSPPSPCCPQGHEAATAEGAESRRTPPDRTWRRSASSPGYYPLQARRARPLPRYAAAFLRPGLAGGDRRSRRPNQRRDPMRVGGGREPCGRGRQPRRMPDPRWRTMRTGPADGRVGAVPGAVSPVFDGVAAIMAGEARGGGGSVSRASPP